MSSLFCNVLDNLRNVVFALVTH